LFVIKFVLEDKIVVLIESLDIFALSTTGFVLQAISPNTMIKVKLKCLIFFFLIIVHNDRAYEHWRIAGDSFSYFYKVTAGAKPAYCESAAIVS